MGDVDPLEIKILVASDIHLGYGERDSVRKKDSIDTFEEVLQIAVKNRVDMLLLGGDLFHENKPSRPILFNCTELLRKYCMNNEPVSLEFLSDGATNFNHSGFPHVNYLDPNMNIGLPVFSINGNHDDMSGNGLSALDQLHATGLINYFGKYQNTEKIDVHPILLRKADGYGGETKVALYGLGSIRDERLNRLFHTNRVTFFTFDDDQVQQSWNNILVLHQNRVRYGGSSTNYIPESVIPEFFDLAIWGHEHPCRIIPEDSPNGVKIMQPGSTVATSLAEGEAGDKCVSLLRIKGKTIADEPIKLQTIRPFYFENIVLSELDIKPGLANTNAKIEKFCDDRVEYYREQAMAEFPNNPRSEKPLIRLRIDYTGGFEMFNARRFGNKYINTVANSRDIVLFHKKREQKESTDIDMNVLSNVVKRNAKEMGDRVEDMVKEYFKNATDESHKLTLLTENALGAAVKEFVNKDEKDAIDEMVKQQILRMQEKIEENCREKDSKDGILKFIKGIRDLRLRRGNDADEQETIDDALRAATRRRQQDEANGSFSSTRSNNERDEPMDDISVEGDDGDANDMEITAEVTPAQARSAAGTSRGARGGSRGRGASADRSPARADTSARGGRGRPRGSTSRGRARGRGATKRSLEHDEGEGSILNYVQSGGSRARAGSNASKRSAISREEVTIEEDDDF